MKMKSLTAMLAVVMIPATAGAVLAADLGGGNSMKDAGFASSNSSSNWTGFEFGVQGGYAWNKHKITATSKDVVPGAPAYCTDGNTLKDDGKCYTPAVPASCTGGAHPGTGTGANKCFKTEPSTTCNQPAADGFCYQPVVVTPASCPAGLHFGSNGHGCYKPDGTFSVAETPAKTENQLVMQEVETTEAEYVPAVASKESPLSFVPAVDAQTIIQNTLLGIDTNGLFGGGHVGYNYQPSGTRVVIGVFGDFNFADSNTTKDGLIITDGNSYEVGARLGVLLTPDLMVYGLGGYGWQQVSYAQGTDGVDHTFGHFIAGAGAERMISHNLGIGVEYQHWFETEATIHDSYATGGSLVKDARSDDRILGRLNYHIPVGN